MTEQHGAKAPILDYTQSLEPARRFAKGLLKRLRSGDAAALAELRRHHPHFDTVAADPKLADALLVAARLMGYRSWPQLKHHHEAMQRCQREIDEGAPPPDADVPTVHVRCGSDIQRGLQEAGYVGDFVEVSDPLCQGPVPSGDHETLVRGRAAFVAQAYGLDHGETQARLRDAWSALDRAAASSRVVLWFEHDSYDQLILAAVLDRLHASGPARVELICIEEYPGHAGFRGLGELRQVSLRGLWDARKVVGAETFALGSAVWAALRRPDPSALHALATRGTPAIVPMARALTRHLQELPWTTDGLSLTQRLTLEIVAAGAKQMGPVFRSLVTEVEPLPFLGDAMFWWEARQLAAGGALELTPTEEPWPRWGVALGGLGEALLAGTADWVEASRQLRWVGGVPCGPDHPPWRWDPEARRPRLNR